VVYFDAIGDSFVGKKLEEEFSDKEAQARFEVALPTAMSTPHKPLKEKPQVKKAKKKAKTQARK
jgi:hypothetical protein